MGWSLAFEEVAERPDGQVLYGYARNASTIELDVLPDGEVQPEGLEPRLSDLPCTSDQAAAWR